VSIAQGATGSPVNISVASQNGFAGSVEISLTGLPAGVIANPTVNHLR
jgi:hypothetical protein